MFQKKIFSIPFFLFLICASTNAQSIPEKVSPEQIYAPILFFDSGEDAPLTSVDSLLAHNVNIEQRRKIFGKRILKAKIDLSDLSHYNDSLVSRKSNKQVFFLQTNSFVTKFDSIVYTHKILIDNFLYLQYWFFYSFNDVKGISPSHLFQKCGNHQGDWEHISLKINLSKFTEAQETGSYLSAIEEIYFAQHARNQYSERKFKKTYDSDVFFSGTHVEVFIARGSHASYSQPNKGKGFELMKIFGKQYYDIADGKGISLNTSTHLIDMATQPWSKFAGKWGEITCDICNILEWFSDASNDGPFGPLQHKPYDSKSDWFER